MSKGYCPTTETLDLIQRYVSPNATLRLKKLIENIDAPVFITNTGVVSSGKSSLYNALLNRTSGERFLTGAARTTKAEDSEEFFEGVMLVDTPGIDVKEEDDKAALEALASSSIVVMIHNIKMGMLHANEINWLKKIFALYRSKQELKDRFVFVCSWIDERDKDAEDYAKAVNETRRMLNELAGIEVDFYEVSAKRFIAGMEKNKPALVKKSAVPQFRESLRAKAEYYSEHYGRRARLDELWEIVDKCSEALKSRQGICRGEWDAASGRVRFEAKRKMERWGSVYEPMKDMVSEVEEIASNINHMQSKLDTFESQEEDIFTKLMKGDTNR